ncbi:hypothetical protein [Bacillus sp. FJAT-27445]|uniref:hypothetical protein n=1 Tax=Bacillus sp. FJAT-27445 TaxID=1679166 RepID=UPI000743BBE0|nr:hypothetical protein [Bacillus sp. FJAT-27445]
MKKKLCILFAGTIFAAMLTLAGCGTNDDEQNPPPPQDRIHDNKGNDVDPDNDGRVDEDGLPSDTNDNTNNMKKHR